MNIIIFKNSLIYSWNFSIYISITFILVVKFFYLLLDIEFWAHNTNLLVDQMIYDIFINYYMNNFTVLSVVGVL